MQIQHIAPVGERIVINMSDGSVYTGHFNSLTIPFISFTWDENNRNIYLNTEQIVSVYVLEGEIDRNENQEQDRNILGNHTSHARK